MKLKTIPLYIILMSCILLITSCSKEPEKVLPKNGGVWQVTGTLAGTNNDGIFSKTITGIVEGTMTFNSNNTGQQNLVQKLKIETSFETINTLINQKSDFTWNVDGDAIKITSDNKALTFDITNKESKSETWKAKGLVEDVTVTYDYNLEKK